MKKPKSKTGTARTSKNVKKLSGKGRSPKKVKDPSTTADNRPTQGEPVPETEE